MIKTHQVGTEKLCYSKNTSRACFKATHCRKSEIMVQCYQEKAAFEHTFQNVGHSVLGVSWQNTAEAVNELGRPEFHNQLPQSFTAEKYTFYSF